MIDTAHVGIEILSEINHAEQAHFEFIGTDVIWDNEVIRRKRHDRAPMCILHLKTSYSEAENSQ